MMAMLMEYSSCVIKERDHDVEQATCMELEKRAQKLLQKRFLEQSNFIRHAGQHGRWSWNIQISEGCELALKDCCEQARQLLPLQVSALSGASLSSGASRINHLQLNHHQLQQFHLQLQLWSSLQQGNQQGYHTMFPDILLGWSDLGRLIKKGSETTTSKLFTSVGLDGSVASDKLQNFLPEWRAQGPPAKKKFMGKGDEAGVKCAKAGRCHCSKRRKSYIKRTSCVPAISS